MPLDKQQLSLSFVGGIETKTDPKQIILSKLASLENGIFISPKEIRKRNGYDPLSSFISPSGTFASGNFATGQFVEGHGLATFKEELLAFDGQDLYSYSPSIDKWFLKDDLANIDLSVASVLKNTNEQTAQDSCFHSFGLQCFVWEDSSGGSRYSIVDTNTNNVLVNNSLLNINAVKPIAVTVGNYLLLIYYNTLTADLECLPIPVVTPSAPSTPFSLTATIDPVNFNYDAATIGDRVFVAYNDAAGLGGISVFYLNAFIQRSSDLQVAGENADGCITLFNNPINNNVWVSYYNGTDVRYFIRDYSLSNSPVLSPTTIETIANVETIAGCTLNGVGYIYYTISQTNLWDWFVRWVTATDLGVVSTPSDFLRSVGLASKPFAIRTKVYVGLTHESDLQPTYYLANSDGKIVARYAYANGGGQLTKNIVPSTNQIGTTTYSNAYLKKDLFTTQSGNIYTQTGMESVIFDFDQNNSFITAEIANNLHISGGIVSMYDGGTVVEHGFNLYPEPIAISDSTSGGSISDGQRQYAVTYEWFDNQGQLHRSAPSIPFTVTNSGGGTSSNTLTIPTLRLTDKINPNPVMIVVYRTEASGTIFYQLTSITTPLLNNTSVDTVVYVDTVDDPAIIGNPLLYTTGGVLENIPIPAATVISTYKNRVIYVPSEDRLSVGYSKETTVGSPVEFSSDTLYQVVDSFGGPINVVKQMDDKIIIFKETAIYGITGDGPVNTGEQNDFTPAQLITSDCGCIDAKSVVITPTGLMFKSTKGIYLLNRGLQVSYIGSDVEFWNSDTVVSATLVADTNQVRFCLNTGLILMYDYYFNQWSPFTGLSAVDSLIWNDTFVFQKANGKVLVESESFTDEGRFIKLRLKTSWLSLAGLLGFQRIYRMIMLGEYISPHQLIVGVAYDFNPVVAQQEYVDAETLLTNPIYGIPTPYGNPLQEPVYGGFWPLYQFRLQLEQQKCEAVQFTLEDTQNHAYGEGYSISALGIEIGVKKGLDKMSSERTIG